MLKENTVTAIAQEVQKVIKGKEDVIESVLTAILAKGHILIEDIPGVGKTTLALAFSKVMDLEYKRMQFTPDVLPTDVVGFSVLTRENTFEYKPGAVLCNLFLADEINRTSSKTQSALLEVMEEGSVTVDGVTRRVPDPFVVIATQNPVGSVGTQMLPESQLDRFMVRLTMGYPDITQEIDILKGKQAGEPLKQIRQVATREEIVRMQQEVTQVYVHDVLYAYIAALVAATRKHPLITLGVSPRGSIALTNMVKARAYVHNRDYVIPEDITEVFYSVVGHRLVLNPKARVNHMTAKDLTDQILSQVAPPKL